MELAYLGDGHNYDSIVIRRRKTVEPLNLANISTSDRTDEINFKNPKSLRVWNFPFGVVDI